MINQENFIQFVTSYADTAIGMDLNGCSTTLAQELGTVGKLITRGDVIRIGVDPYRHSRIAFSIAELTDEEKAARIARNYKVAAKKILWLNTICKQKTGVTFVEKRVNLQEWNDVEMLCDSIMETMRVAE